MFRADGGNVHNIHNAGDAISWSNKAKYPGISKGENLSFDQQVKNSAPVQCYSNRNFTFTYPTSDRSLHTPPKPGGSSSRLPAGGKYKVFRIKPSGTSQLLRYYESNKRSVTQPKFRQFETS